MISKCPVNTVDEHAVRTCAGIVVVLATLSFWFPAVIVLLALDFAVRGFGDRRYSPLRWVAKLVVSVLRLEPKHVYAPPKRFAAQIGSVLTAFAALLSLLSLQVHSLQAAAFGMAGLLIAAATLEAVFGFCIACWVYPIVFRVRSS